MLLQKYMVPVKGLGLSLCAFSLSAAALLIAPGCAEQTAGNGRPPWLDSGRAIDELPFVCGTVDDSEMWNAVGRIIVDVRAPVSYEVSVWTDGHRYRAPDKGLSAPRGLESALIGGGDVWRAGDGTAEACVCVLGTADSAWCRVQDVIDACRSSFVKAPKVFVLCRDARGRVRGIRLFADQREDYARGKRLADALDKWAASWAKKRYAFSL